MSKSFLSLLNARSARKKFSVFLLLAGALVVLIPEPAHAQTCPTTPSGTFTSSGGTIETPENSGNGTQYSANIYPSTVTATGLSGSVCNVTLTLNDVNANTGMATGNTNDYEGLSGAEILLVSADGSHMLQFLGTVGPLFGDNITDLNMTFEDSAGNYLPDCGGSNISPDTGSGSWKPSSFDSNSSGNECGYGNPNFPSPGPGTVGTAYLPHSDGSATLTSAFTGATANGTWSLYLVDYNGDAVSIASWTLNIYTLASSEPTTTSLASTVNPAYNASSGNSTTFTATVSPVPSPVGGTVTFSNNGTNLTCSGGNGVAIDSIGQASCTTTFSANTCTGSTGSQGSSVCQGDNTITATFSGYNNYVTSNGTIDQVIEAHTANPTGYQYCNDSPFYLPGEARPQAYPSIIQVPATFPASEVTEVTVTLNNINGYAPYGQYLLVSPDGVHNLDFLDSAWQQDSSSDINVTIDDTAGQTPGNTAPESGTYEPFDENANLDTFPSPSETADVISGVPQVPSPIEYAEPKGSTSNTLEARFNAATAVGNWALYPYMGVVETGYVGSWCITLTPAAANNTTTTVTSSVDDQYTGQPVTLTATVKSGSTDITSGTVTFLDNGLVPAGTSGGNNVVSLNSNGQATFTTSSLTEGDHPFTASYSGDSTYNPSEGSFVQRIDDNSVASVTGTNTYQYCNQGAVESTTGVKGAFTPNPSNVFVTNLPGTVSSVGVTLNRYFTDSTETLDVTEALLQGPNGTSGNNLDFFSYTGDLDESLSDATLTFSDSAAGLVGQSSYGSGTYKPSSYNTSGDEFFSSSSGLFNAPSTINYAATKGSSTLNGEFVGTNTIGNGTWSLFFDVNEDASQEGAAGGWCMNFTENPVTVSTTASHNGSGQDGDFVVGEQDAQIDVSVTNEGTGSTGDPTSGSNPLTVTDTLASGLTYAHSTGTGWSCSASGQTVTCTNDDTIAQSASYPTLTINVNVAGNAPSSLNNSVRASGAGVTGANSATDTITVDQAPSLAVAVAQSGTFTQGQPGQWNITVSNTQTGSITSGTVTVTDTFPTGYMLSNYSGTGWSCGGTSTATCTSTQGISGGSSFPTLALTVSVPATSPTSVADAASAYGGGDTTHSSAGTAAVSNTDTVTVAQVPATVAITSGNNQSAQVELSFNALEVTVTDAAGVPIAGQSVTFTAPGSGAGCLFSNGTGSFSASTNSSGQASATLSANTVAGSYEITATAGSASNIFAVTNTAGLPATVNVVSGSGQSAIVGQPFASQLTVTVTDTFSNVVPGVTVTFTAPASGASATFSSSGSCTTNSSGQCSVTATANSTSGGPYNVTASVSGASPATFSLTNSPPPSFVVNTAGDSGSGASDCPQNPTTSGPGNCTLRDAISAAEAAGVGNITFDSSVFSSPQSINLASGAGGAGSTLAISGQVNIQGPGARQLTIAGDDDENVGSVVTVGSGAQVSISGLTISDGYPRSGSGGGINNQGTLTLSNSAVSGNNIDSPGSGAGIYNSGTLTLNSTTVSGNSAIPEGGSGGGGGGIFSSGTLTLIDSTVTGNSLEFYSSGGGGGIFIGGGTATIIDSTVSSNSNAQLCTPGGCMGGPGGGINNAGTLTLWNSIVAGNTSGTDADVSGAFATASANNLIGDGTGMSGITNGSNSNQVGTSASPINPQLVTGGGGPTETAIPLPGSPAICAGSASAAAGAGITTDQRGVALNAGGYCASGSIDVGAVQTDYALSFTAQPSNVAQNAAMSPAPEVTLDENGAPFTASAVTIPMSLTSNPTGATLTGGSAATSGGVATYSLSVNELGTGDTLTATLVLNPAISPTAPALTATSGTFDVLTPQTITFNPIDNQIVGTFAALSASASSGQPVVFTSLTTSVCTVSGTTAALLETGTCSIMASQGGNNTYAPAPSVTQTFTVDGTTPQTITFNITGTQYVLGTVPLAGFAAARSGLTISFASNTLSVCTVSGTTANLLTTGTCSITASQSGNSTYSPATPVTQTFIVYEAPQTISFSPVTGTYYALGQVSLSGTASSGLAVTFTSGTTPVCTVSGTTVSLLEAGTCSIQASQPGNSQYAAAPFVYQSFGVSKIAQTISFGPITGTYYALGQVSLSATASSGLAVTFTSGTASVCTVSGTTVSLLEAGTCSIKASQAGNSQYAAAAVSRSFGVSKAAQTISFSAITGTYYALGQVSLSATASSGLAVTFTSGTTSVCTVSGTTVSLLEAGTCSIRASQQGNSQYAAASVSRSFGVSKAAQTISFSAITGTYSVPGPVSLSATASSGLAVTFTSGTTSVCTVSGTTASLLEAGTCTIKASQPGNSQYAPAPLVYRSFTVN